MKSKINIKKLYNLDIEGILSQYNNKTVLYKFLIYLIKDTQKHYDIVKNKEVYFCQKEVIRLLERLLAGELVLEKEIGEAINAAYVAYNAADAANVAYNAAYTTYHAANTAYTTYHAAYAANAARAASYVAHYAAEVTKKSVEAYKIDLISLILEAEGINNTNFELLYKWVR